MLSLLASAILIQAPIPGPVDALLRSHGYERSEVTEIDARYFNPIRKGSVRWTWKALRTSGQGPAVMAKYDSMNAYRPPNDWPLPPPSNLPIGHVHRYYPGTQSVMFRVASESHFVQVNIGVGARMGAGGTPDYVPMKLSDNELAEAVTRWLLATIATEGMSRTTWSHRSQSYPAIRSKAGRMHVPARTLAQRRGMAFTWNEAAGRMSLASPRGQVLLVLGAPSVKVGSEWIPVGDVVVADGAEPMIPIEIVARIDP